MKRIFLTLSFCCVATAALAAEGQQVDPLTQERSAVLVELSQRSGLPAADLSRILSDCKITQQSLFFCAWRDQIAANRGLERVLAERNRRFPICIISMDSKVKSWAKSRDESCAKSATTEFGDGSMKPTARAMCVTAETLKMTRRLERLKGCMH